MSAFVKTSRLAGKEFHAGKWKCGECGKLAEGKTTRWFGEAYVAAWLGAMLKLSCDDCKRKKAGAGKETKT